MQPCCFSSSRSASLLSPKKKNSNNSLIRDQNSNKHIADGCKKLFRAFKREAVQFLVAENLAVSYLPLEAPTAVQTCTWTASATARPWSRDILWFVICGFPWKPDARGLYWRNQAARERLENWQFDNERVVEIDFIFLSAVLHKKVFCSNPELTLVPVFNVSNCKFHFILLISLWPGPGFIGLLVSSRIPCQLTIPICILALYYILA